MDRFQGQPAQLGDGNGEDRDIGLLIDPLERGGRLAVVMEPDHQVLRIRHDMLVRDDQDLVLIFPYDDPGAGVFRIGDRGAVLPDGGGMLIDHGHDGRHRLLYHVRERHHGVDIRYGLCRDPIGQRLEHGIQGRSSQDGLFSTRKPIPSR